MLLFIPILSAIDESKTKTIDELINSYPTLKASGMELNSLHKKD